MSAVEFTLDEMRAALADRPEFRFSEFEGLTVGCYMVASDDAWEHPLARECRGVTFDATGAIIGRPLPKFFNVGERADTQPDVIDWSQIDEVYEKRDGSLIHTVRTADGYRLKSKKSFAAPQVLAAQAWLEAQWLNEESSAFAAWIRIQVNLGRTVIMEWTAPDNRVVIAYDEPRLTVLHVRHNETGAFLPREKLEREAAEWAFPLVAKCGLDHATLLDLAKTTEGVEGWVLQFCDGTLMKLKTRWYLDRHHYMTALRERDVAEAVLNETLDDIKTVISADDPQILDTILRIEHGVVSELELLASEVDAMFAGTAGKDRKSIAVEHKAHPLFALLMQRVSGKEPDFKKHYARRCLDERWGLDVISTFGKRGDEQNKEVA